MLKRRGSLIRKLDNLGRDNNRVSIYEVGDFVLPVIVKNESFFGTVEKVSVSEGKIYVAWLGGDISQHDADELMPHPHFTDGKELARRFKRNPEEINVHMNASESDVQYDIGSDKLHGRDKPLGGGTDVMKNLAYKLQEEALKESGVVRVDDTIPGDRMSSVQRYAAYHHGLGRVYRKTKHEMNEGHVRCPRCSCDCDKHKFTRGIAIFICPECEWKITSDKLI